MMAVSGPVRSNVPETVVSPGVAPGVLFRRPFIKAEEGWAVR